MFKYTSNLVVLLILMQSITVTVSGLYLPSFPKIAHYFAINKVDVQFTLSLFFLGLFIFSFLSNILIRMIGQRRILTLGCFIFIGASLFCMFSESILWLKIGLFSLALGSGPLIILSTAFMGHIDETERHSVMNTVYFYSSVISSIIAPFIGGLISDYIWWQFIFVAYAIFGFIMLYRVHSVFENNAKFHIVINADVKEYFEIILTKPFTFFFGIKWLLGIASQAFYIEIPFILHTHGFSTKAIGITIVATGTGYILGAFFYKILGKYLDTRRLLVTALIISASGGLLCGYQIVDFNIYFLIFAAWILMIGQGMSSTNLMVLVINYMRKELHTKMSALYNMVTLLLSFIVTSIIGHIANYSMNCFYLFLFAFPIIAVFVFIISKVCGCLRREKA